MYIGIDLHKIYAVVTALDDSGQEVVTTRFRNHLKGWNEFHETFPDGGHVVLEATLNHMEVVDLLEDWGYEVSVAHCKSVRAIATSKTKTDKIDSHVLAKLLQSDFLPTAYVPPKQIREMRELLRHRIHLGRDAVQIKNRIHALLSKQWVTHEFSDLFGRKGRQFLSSLELPAIPRYVLDSLLKELDVIHREISATQSLLAKYSVKDDDVQRLMQIRGIDFYSAQIIVSEIGDVHRFPSHRQLASYAGIVPTVRNSADKVRHGHITKEGNRNLRWILVESAMHAKNTNPKLKRIHARLSKRRGRMIARVAIARHLLRIIYYMLRDKTDYHHIDESLYEDKTKRLHSIARLHDRRFEEATMTIKDNDRPGRSLPKMETVNKVGNIKESVSSFS